MTAMASLNLQVLIGRDIKWDVTSRRQESQLERTALLLTEVSGQLQRIDSDVKVSHQTLTNSSSVRSQRLPGVRRHEHGPKDAYSTRSVMGQKAQG